jgi:hypothetical protein
MKLEFGLKPPAGAKVAWGARAVYRSRPRAEFDLLWDRQSVAGPERERMPLYEWLNKRALPELRKIVEDEFLPGSSWEEVSFEDLVDGYAIKASPRGSCGYLYIVAWKLEKVRASS